MTKKRWVTLIVALFLVLGLTSASALACEPSPPGDEGCTPGYWKDHAEEPRNAWPPTGYSPGDDSCATFGVDLFDSNITLLDALRARGGKKNRLARHATAAQLNAAHPDVNYGVADVIALVREYAVTRSDALVDRLEWYNELGCPLN